MLIILFGDIKNCALLSSFFVYTVSKITKSIDSFKKLDCFNCLSLQPCFEDIVGRFLALSEIKKIARITLILNILWTTI